MYVGARRIDHVDSQCSVELEEYENLFPEQPPDRLNEKPESTPVYVRG